MMKGTSLVICRQICLLGVSGVVWVVLTNKAWSATRSCGSDDYLDLMPLAECSLGDRLYLMGPRWVLAKECTEVEPRAAKIRGMEESVLVAEEESEAPRLTRARLHGPTAERASSGRETEQAEVEA